MRTVNILDLTLLVILIFNQQYVTILSIKISHYFDADL